MRKLQEVQNEFTNLCAKLGQLEISRQRVEVQIKELLKHSDQLEAEGQSILAFEKEVAAASAKPVEPTDSTVSS